VFRAFTGTPWTCGQSSTKHKTVPWTTSLAFLTLCLTRPPLH
jgi:hypothetical protein